MFIDSLSDDALQTFLITHTGSANADVVLALSAFNQNNGGEWLLTVAATDYTLNNTFVQTLGAAPGVSAAIPLVVEPGAIITITAERTNSAPTSQLRLRACIVDPNALGAVAAPTAGEFVLVSR